MSKVFTRLMLAAMLMVPAGLAHANFEGSAKSFPAKAARTTPFKTGKYRLTDNNGNYQDVLITAISGSRYRINGTGDSERNGIAIFYPNGGGSFVLSLYENGKYGYFIADRTKGGLRVLDTAYAANELLNGKPKDGIPTALDALPYKKAEQNQAFMRKLYAEGNRRWMRVLFTAKATK